MVTDPSSTATCHQKHSQQTFMTNTAPKLIIVVGMARSGTTLVSHVMGSVPGIHVEVEPHALWKTGNFKYDTDEEFDIKPAAINHIRSTFLAAAEQSSGRCLMEKSPSNCLRPGLVHATVPEAKLVYLERDAASVIYSNVVRSQSKDSFKPSIIFKKYLWSTGTPELPGAYSSRNIFQQLRLSDMPQFIRYTLKMFHLRSKDLLPFGPKIRNFKDVVQEKGVLGYHVEVYRRAMEHKETFKNLFGDQYMHFTMQEIMHDESALERLFEFCDVDVDGTTISKIRETFDLDRVKSAKKQNDTVDEINRLLAT